MGLRSGDVRVPVDTRELGPAAPRIPLPVYLVEHADGLVLFDAGLDPDHAEDPAGAYGAMAEHIAMDFREEYAIEVQLAGLGLTARDVTTVVASHLLRPRRGVEALCPRSNGRRR